MWLLWLGVNYSISSSGLSVSIYHYTSKIAEKYCRIIQAIFPLLNGIVLGVAQLPAWLRWRPFCGQQPPKRRTNQCRVCPLLGLVKEPLFQPGSVYDRESTQRTFSVGGAWAFLPSLKPFPSSKFASQRPNARGQSLDRGCPVQG